jgi:hypothetical protein
VIGGAGGATFASPAAIGQGKFFDGAFGPNGALALGFHNDFRGRSLAGPADAAAAALNGAYQVNSEVGFSGAAAGGLVVWGENSGDDLNAVRVSVRSLLRRE